MDGVSGVKHRHMWMRSTNKVLLLKRIEIVNKKTDLPVVVVVAVCVSYGFMIAGNAKLKTRRDNFITGAGGETLIRSQGSSAKTRPTLGFQETNHLGT